MFLRSFLYYICILNNQNLQFTLHYYSLTIKSSVGVFIEFNVIIKLLGLGVVLCKQSSNIITECVY